MVRSRATFIALMPPDGTMLEIGPFSAPCEAPHRTGPIRYLDIMPTEELRATAATLAWANAALVPEIDLENRPRHSGPAVGGGLGNRRR